jgi:hypothetical protein
VAPTNEQTTYVTTADGRRITYARWRYEETIKQERILAQVGDLLMDKASSAVSVGATLGQQEYGGLLRVVIPQLLDQYGKVNATAAVNFYDQTQLAWLQANGSEARQRASRGNVRRQSERVARARTQSALELASTGVDVFKAKFADSYDLLAKSENVIGFAMKVRARDGHEPSVVAMNNALTREVASYHRDTILFNAALDSNVSRVQRVAQASACEFCRLMALGSTNGSVRVSNYAVKFHDHCHCTIQPLFEGEAPFRPDYYDDFEKDYDQARKEAGSGNSRDILAQMRKQSKQPVTVSAPKPYKGIGDALDDADSWRDKITFAQVVGEQANDPNGDSLLSYFADRQRFNGKPTTVRNYEELGSTPLFRGLADKGDLKASQMVKDYITKDSPYQGLGYTGNGTYFATRGDSVVDTPWEVAAKYGRFEANSLEDVLKSPNSIVAGLADDANFMEFDDNTTFGWHTGGLQQKWKEECIARGIKPGDPVYDVADRFQGISVLMLLDGVDAWRLNNSGYMVVVNRGKLKVLDK